MSLRQCDPFGRLWPTGEVGGTNTSCRSGLLSHSSLPAPGTGNERQTLPGMKGLDVILQDYPEEMHFLSPSIFMFSVYTDFMDSDNVPQ